MESAEQSERAYEIGEKYYVPQTRSVAMAVGAGFINLPQGTVLEVCKPDRKFMEIHGEHVDLNTTPGTTLAPKLGKTSLYNPHCTYASTSSLRLATP